MLHLIAPGPLAGAERMVLGGGRALIDAGALARLGVLGDRRHPELERGFLAAARELDVPTWRLTTRGRTDVRAVMALRRHLDHEAYDLLHVHGYKALVYGLAARRGGSPLVATHHGETQKDRTVRVYERLAVALYRRADRVVAVTRPTAEHLTAQGVPRVHTVENFLPSRGGDRALTPAPAAGPLALLFIGRLSIEKGVDVLLEALAAGPAALQLTVLGDGAERADLEALCGRLGLSARVHFAGWQDDVGPYLDRAGAVVMPSLREGLPLTAIEAAAAGRPVVASRVGGIPDVIKHGETGLLVEPGQPAALASALSQLVERREALQHAAFEAAPAIRQRFAPAKWAQETLADYRQVLEARP